jgi:sialate O-acetylesterase
MKLRPLLLAGFTLFSVSSLVRSEITLAPIFSDHAVLQRDKPLPIWGRGAPGEKISVSFRGQTVRTTVDANGRWIVFLEATPASVEPSDLVVAGRETITLHDILVGEVWLASGQSNMEWTVANLREDERALAAVDLPLVRHLKIERAVADSPADTARTSGWKSASPQTVGEFSAVGYFFAREIQRKLGVPVGILNSSYGGTSIESWMSDASRNATSIGAALAARWKQEMSEWPPERVARYSTDLETWQKADEIARATKKKNLVPWPAPPATLDSPARPGGLFNGMIAPLQPAAIRGILWYQGESNASRASEYAELFPAMIRAWRANWGDAQLPFYFVQLPNWADDNPRARTWARLREAQAKALELPATAMVVAIDVGDPDDIHPKSKTEVARRLALAAKAQLYGISGDSMGPTFAGVLREGAALRVRFNHAGSGLVAHQRPVQSLEIAGADKVFYAATAKIERDTLLVLSPSVKDPVAVRYAWSNAPIANLYSGSGLPAAPFRSDDW